MAEVTFTVEASDLKAEDPPIQVGSASVTINILSETDNLIRLDPRILIRIPEEEPLNTVLTTVVAYDPENNNQPLRDYRKVASTDPNNYFIVDQETGNIRLNTRMDYEDPVTRQRSFQLEAFTEPPNPRSAMATIIVIAEDINDHSPVFSREVRS